MTYVIFISCRIIAIKMLAVTIPQNTRVIQSALSQCCSV